MRLAFALSAGLLLLLATKACAQNGGNISGGDVTVQLPSYQTTGVNTTVLVPDRGRAPLARQRQAAYERSYFSRYPRYRPTTRQQLNNSLSVTAHIHDPRAAEADIQRTSRSRRANWVRGDNLRMRY